ncbi:MAG TPA: lyase family protein, partial [Spirochaetota bacterium]|nr:lyase family protein [Spirochaetota bacterium]
IIWSNKQFEFIEMDDAFATGSSIMPNKKNPDACELLRGKSGRVYGALFSILTVLKGLPAAYSKDLQEDKEGLFDVVDTVNASLKIFSKLLKAVSFKPENMLKACANGFIQATAVADYLADKGIPFRDAHHISGQLVKYMEEHGKKYADLTLSDFRRFSDKFDKDILPALELEHIINRKQSAGSTSGTAVKEQLKQAAAFLAGVRI